MEYPRRTRPVTFSQNGPKLNSSSVYCSRPYSSCWQTPLCTKLIFFGTPTTMGFCWVSAPPSLKAHVVQSCALWQYGLWSFQTGYIQLERFLPKNQHAQRKFLNFENWTNGEPQQLAKIRDFKVHYFDFSYKTLIFASE